jgi:hypothetical protein
VAVKAFAKIDNAQKNDQDPSYETTKNSILQRLRKRAGQQNLFQNLKSFKRMGNQNAKKTTRKVQVGWFHSDTPSGKYHQVNSKCGGGVRDLQCEKEATVANIQEEAMILFFPNGRSNNGKLHDFKVTMMDSTTNILQSDQTVGGELYKLYKVSKLRVYFATKPKSSRDSTTSDIDVDNLPDLPEPTGHSTPTTSQSVSAGFEYAPHLEVSDETNQVTGTYAPSSPASSTVVPTEVLFYDTSPSTVTLDEVLNDFTGSSTVTQAGLLTDFTAPSTVTEAGLVTAFTPPSPVTQAGILTYFTAPSTVTQAGVPTDFPVPTTVTQTEVVSNVTAPETVQVNDSTSTATASSVLERDTLPMLMRPRTSRSSEMSTSYDSEIQFGPVTGDIDMNEILPGKTQVRLHRGHVFTELLDDMITGSLTERSRLSVTMVLPNGKIESAADSGGVVKDTLTEFWETFKDKCTIGNTLRIPCIRHDMQKEHWVAIAKILAMGYSQCGYLPIYLAPPFLATSIPVDEDIELQPDRLIEVFMHCIPDQDREVMEAALNDFDSVDEDELIDTLSSYDVKVQVKRSNVKSIVGEIANRDIIQAPAYIVTSWQEVLQTALKPLLRTPISELLVSLQPTTKKVLKCLHFPSTLTDVQKTTAGYLKKFIKMCDARELRNFLRFCTGKLETLFCTKFL